MPNVIGIDLGTTNSVVAVIEGGDPVVIPNAEGERITPSVVGVNKHGERLVGQVARRQAVTNAEHTIFSVKRFQGRTYDDPTVQADQGRIPYQLRPSPNGGIQVVMGGREYAPPQIAAMILQKLKADAEAYLGETVDRAVITVPAYFNDSQRQATKDAGRIAGLEVLRIINEPTASALAYGLQKQSETQCVAVYDMGGGTFDISILELSEGVVEVKATSGNTHLGGDDFDQRIIDWLAEQFVEEHQIELREDRVALQRLKEAAEKAKMELSSMLRTEISLPFVTADEHGPKHLQATLSRATLEQLCADLIEQSIEPVKQALEDANLTPEQIDEVILVGGQTRMPAVQQAVREFFGKEPNKTVNPDEVVAIGAAVQAGVIDGVVKDVLLLDVTPLTLGIETLGGMMAPLIERNTTIPTRKSKTVSTASDNQVAVEIHVLQGERAEVKFNKSLGKFELTDIAPGPRGVPQIEVTFDIDVNGITHVSAQDKATGKEQGITITASSGLTSEEIARMIDDAQTHREEDTQRRQHIAVQNAADSAIYAARKLLRLAGERVDETTLQTVHERIAALQAVLESDDTATIQQQTDDLSTALQPIHLILANKNGDNQQQNGQEGEQQQQETEQQQQDRHEDPNEQHENEKT